MNTEPIDALILIRDISDDRDGYTTAKNLGELVDELHEIAKKAVAEAQNQP